MRKNIRFKLIEWSKQRRCMCMIFTRTNLLTSIVKNVNELINRLRDVMKQSISQIEEKMTDENIKFEFFLDIDFEKIQLTNQYQALSLLSQQEEVNIQLTIEFENTANREIFIEKFTIIATSFVFSSEILNFMFFFRYNFVVFHKIFLSFYRNNVW